MVVTWADAIAKIDLAAESLDSDLEKFQYLFHRDGYIEDEDKAREFESRVRKYYIPGYSWRDECSFDLAAYYLNGELVAVSERNGHEDEYESIYFVSQQAGEKVKALFDELFPIKYDPVELKEDIQIIKYYQEVIKEDDFYAD